MRNGDEIRDQNPKSHHGPALRLNIVDQGLFLRRKFVGNVAIVAVVIVYPIHVVFVDKQPVGDEEEIDNQPAEPGQQVDRDNRAGVDAAVAGPFENADALGDVPAKCDDELFEESIPVSE